MDAKLEKAATSLTKQLLKSIDDGVGPMNGARAYADARLASSGDREAAIRRIVNETLAASATTGFTTGLGGFLVLPVALPANITGQALLNARMVASIAHLRGWDLNDDFVRYSILIVIAGGSPNAVFSQLGVKIGQEAAKAAIKKIPIEFIRLINKRVGFMLLAKYGSKRSAITLAKFIPVAGGVIGGAVDATFTKVVSTGAKRAFPSTAAATTGAPPAAPGPNPTTITATVVPE